jgi:hypothetical protein
MPQEKLEGMPSDIIERLPRIDSKILDFIRNEGDSMSEYFDLPLEQQMRFKTEQLWIKDLGEQCKNKAEFDGRFFGKIHHLSLRRMVSDFIAAGYLRPEIRLPVLHDTVTASVVREYVELRTKWPIMFHIRRFGSRLRRWFEPVQM